MVKTFGVSSLDVGRTREEIDQKANGLERFRSGRCDVLYYSIQVVSDTFNVTTSYQLSIVGVGKEMRTLIDSWATCKMAATVTETTSRTNGLYQRTLGSEPPSVRNCVTPYNRD